VKITPLDIRQKRFESALSGFRKTDVESFLESVASEVEELVKSNGALRDELNHVQLRLQQQLDRERTLQETLLTAQRLSENIKTAQRRKQSSFLLRLSTRRRKSSRARTRS